MTSDHHMTDMQIPIPQDGNEYTKHESVNIVSMLPEGSKLFRLCNEIIKRKYVPVSIQTIRKMMRKHQAREIIKNDPWTGGRPRICDDNAVAKLSQKIECFSGKSFGRKDMKGLLIDNTKAMLLDSDIVPLDNPHFCASTIDNYIVELANQHNISLTQKTIAKSGIRFTSENSLRRPINNTALFGSTHFIPVEKQDIDIRNELKDVPEETRRLYDMVTDALDTPVYPVAP